MKILSDEERVELVNEFALKNLDDRDDVIFDFEADIKRMFKKLDLKKLINKDKKYIKALKSAIYNLVLQSYLEDIINIGIKKSKMHDRLFV